MTFHPIELYKVGTKTSFVRRLADGMEGEISYLITHDMENRYYSFGFDPEKVTIAEATEEFEKQLRAGGRLDGADFEG